MQRQYRCADYTVGWVCALPVELAAAQLMLDERHPELEHGETNDDNLYVLGRINGHNVAIGCLPAGRTGTVSVAVVATQMLAAFPKIRFGLMVGIGGGVPSAEADIRLGDVVVSQPDGTFGGVVQYDLGKTTIHGFLRTGSLNSPPDVLLNAVARIQANEYLEKSTLQHHASRLEAERSKFQRSRGGRDILFDASYDHQDPHDRTCTMCDPNKVYIRESRLPGEEVVVHYGTIGSGNKVMKSALERDRVSAQLGGVLCFEMEAAGLMSTFPCLVIRGICDYSDSHKNDRWQPYAAGNAAAYAKEVLSVLKPIEVARTQIAMNDIDGESALQVTHSSRHQQNDRDATTMNNTTSAGVTVTIHGTASRSSSQADQSLYQSQNRSPSPLSIPAKHTLSEEQRKTIKNSLHFKQRDARLLTLKQAQTKTCQWLLKNPKYVDWIHADKLHQHRGFFWIKGKPGSGKSIMMKYLFSCAKRSMHGSIVLSFFFNARGAILEKTTSGLYRALILQLLDKAPQTWTAFEDDDDLDALLNLVEQSGWQDELLRQLFVRCLRKLENERVVCYVDALDECPEAAIRDMISLFEEIGEMKSTAEFRVCFSSRHYPEISIRTGLQLVLELEAEHIDDIALYIDANLRMGNDPQLKEVRAELLRKASGIFLWVHLVIPELNKEYDRGRIKALKKRLAQTPIGLHELFVDILTRDQRKLGHFRRCVEIILHAIRPLNPSELNAALEAYKDVSGFRVDDDSILMDPDGLRKYVLDSSKGLAEITKSVLPTVQWIHESVRDFFLKEGGMIVSYSICENGRSPHHGGTPVEFPRNDSNSNLYANLQHLRHLLERYPDVRYDSAVWPMEDLLSYAASRGFHRITKLYIGSSGIRCREKAFIAATRGKNNQKGRIEVVKQLLDAGLELHHDRDAVKDAMFDMILEPHNEDLVRVLLTRVEWYLEARNRNSLTPLLWALHRGRKTYFKIFLDAGANLMEPNALESAIHMGDLDSLRLLLKNPNCRVDARDELGRTALFWCVSPLGFEDGVLSELLAEPALLPNSTDIRGETALMHAVLLWDEKAVRIMLESGVVSPDGGSSSTQTALGLSLTTYVRTKEDVYLRIARKLLLCGADLYCNRVLPTPADIIAEYDENLYAELRDLCQFSKRQGVHEE